MAIINCGECGKEVSDKAAACPGCGAPINQSSVAALATKEKKKTSKVTWAVLVLMILGVIIYTQTRGYKEQSLPILPVEVASRPAILGPGLVLRVANKSNKELMVVATLTNPTTKQERSFRLDIHPNGFAEVGHKEGWVLATGDTVKLFNDGYQTGLWTIP